MGDEDQDQDDARLQQKFCYTEVFLDTGPWIVCVSFYKKR